MATAIAHFVSGIDVTGARGNPRLFRMAVLAPVSVAHAALVILAAHGIAPPPPAVTAPEPIIVSLVAEAPPPEPITPVIPAPPPIAHTAPRPKAVPHPAATAAAAPSQSAPSGQSASSGQSDAPDAAAVAGEDVAPVVTPPRADAAYLSNPPPAYPATAKRDHQQGRVVLRVLVAADGLAREVAVEQGCGFPLLDDAAAAAIRQWRFVPGHRGESAVEDWVLIPISFKLRT